MVSEMASVTQAVKGDRYLAVSLPGENSAASTLGGLTLGRAQRIPLQGGITDMDQTGLGGRYPDSAVQVLDPRFERYRLPLAGVDRIATGCRWSEGPVWIGDGRYLLWSDIPNERILRWDEETGAVGVFRRPSNYANGNTRDRQGRLVTCEHGTRRVTRTEYDGGITVLADGFAGKRLNSPNDVVVKSDGSVWFTDPPFGILSDYEGGRAEAELPQNVYRVDGSTGEVTAVVEDSRGPNGLCFSPDETLLYVVESRATPNRLIVADDGAGGGRRLQNRGGGRGGRRAAAREQAGGDRLRARHVGRDALRRGRELVVRLGYGERGAGRGGGVRARRRPDRPHRAAGALRQRVLRRAAPQPAVHGGEPVGLRALRQHAGDGRWLRLRST